MAGAAIHLQRLQDGTPSGPSWAGQDSPLGHVIYTTYSEQDYDIVWREYAYQQPTQIWFKKDFGKPGVSHGGAKHAEFSPTIKETWHRGRQQVEYPFLLDLVVADLTACSDLPPVPFKSGGSSGYRPRLAG